MGESLGILGEHGHRRAEELGNVCLWCDEFFESHFNLETLEPRSPKEAERRRRLLPVVRW